MKTALVHDPVIEADRRPPFPFLAASIHEEPAFSFTVLFVGPKAGTVVHRASGCAAWKVGDFHTAFTSVYRPDHWRILSPSETITLQND